MNYLFLICFAIIFTFLPASGSVWKTDLPDDLIVVATPETDSSLIFWSTGDEVGGKDIRNGRDIWKLEIDDWVPLGPRAFSGDTYICIDGDELVAIDMAQGKIRWRLELVDVDEDDFDLAFFPSDDRFVTVFGKTHLVINTYSGQLLWQNDFDMRTFAEEERQYKLISYPSEKYYAVLADRGDVMVTVDIETGTLRGSQADMIPQQQAIDRYGVYYVRLGDTDYVAYIGEDKIVVVDDKTGNIVNYLKGTPPKDFAPISMQADGSAIVMTDQKIILVAQDGVITDIASGYKDFRIMNRINYNGTNYLALSFDGKISLLNTDNGKQVWNSTGPELEDGYIHNFIGVSNGNLICGYGDSGLFSGTWVQIFAYDIGTGSLKWKTEELLKASGSIPALNRWLGDAYNPENGTSWYNPGFKYSSGINKSGNIWLANSYTSRMDLPDNMQGTGGNGFVLIDGRTGGIKSTDYIDLNIETNGGDADYAAVPLLDGDIIYLAGTTHTAAYDINTGKQKFRTEYIDKEQDEFIITEMAVSEGVLLMRSGGVRYNVYMQAPILASWFTSPSVNASETWSSDPIALIGIDAKNGKRLWKRVQDDYPSDILGNGPLTNQLRNSGKQIVNANKLQMEVIDVRSGKPVSITGLGRYGLEDLDDSYAIQTFAIQTVRQKKEYYTYGGRVWEVEKTRTTTFDEDISLMQGALMRSDASIIYEQFGATWGGVATKALGTIPTPFGLYLAGTEYHAMLDLDNGVALWETKWDFDEDDFGYAPLMIGNILFYVLDDIATGLNLETGKILFAEEVESESQFLVSRDNKYIIAFSEDQLLVCKLE